MFGVVLFGIFHGLFLLPAILSIIGPRPYDSAEEIESSSSSGHVSPKNKKNENTPSVPSQTNQGVQVEDNVSNGHPLKQKNALEQNNAPVPVVEMYF